MKIILSLFSCFYIPYYLMLKSIFFCQVSGRNGLSHNTVWYTIQDHQGFMWFGTVTVWTVSTGKTSKFSATSKDSTSLGNNIVGPFRRWRRQNLWVGTNRGIYIFNSQQEEFEFFDNKTEDGVLISSNVYDIEQSHDGSIWIATFGQGLFIYTPQTNTLIQNTQHSSFIKSITSSGSGDMYIGTRQEGIIVSPLTESINVPFLPTSRLRSKITKPMHFITTTIPYGSVSAPTAWTCWIWKVIEYILSPLSSARPMWPISVVFLCIRIPNYS